MLPTSVNSALVTWLFLIECSLAPGLRRSLYVDCRRGPSAVLARVVARSFGVGLGVRPPCFLLKDLDGLGEVKE